eukprot:4827353-Prymnesium_polylepis.1
MDRGRARGGAGASGCRRAVYIHRESARSLREGRRLCSTEKFVAVRPGCGRRPPAEVWRDQGDGRRCNANAAKRHGHVAGGLRAGGGAGASAGHLVQL